MAEPPAPPPDPSPPGVQVRPRRRPILTTALVVLCTLIFLAFSHLNGWRGIVSLELLERFWVLRAERIWNGEFRALLAAPFVHVDPFHLAVNMVFLWLIGNRVERLLGHQTMFAVVFFGAIISSGCELALGEWAPMVGCSGVICALFGLMVALRRRAPMFHHFLRPPMLHVILGLLALSALLDLVGLLPVANVSHLSGLIFGWAVGHLFFQGRCRWPAAAALAALVALCVMGATWLPFSSHWVAWRYLKAQVEGQSARADAVLEHSPFRDDPETLNHIAWRLATSYDKRRRDGARAVELARRACEASNWQWPEIIDTLAAAYAESGQWGEAAATSERAVALLEQLLADETGAVAPQRKNLLRLMAPSLRENLESIRKGEKIRE
ncbi:MAG TPA: rhomboid family intramembrane serine protease [Candidatus Sumerlaeota bacterium]|nr:rhomboid family intramembrane serine protease [Candidatus Sumerlaeota bacterium]